MNSSKKIDGEKIQQMAALARIGIGSEEAVRYAEQMNSILDYMEILQEIDTEGVEMTLQVTGLKNVTRADQVITETDPQALLEVSTLPKIAGQIAVRAVLKEE